MDAAAPATEALAAELDMLLPAPVPAPRTQGPQKMNYTHQDCASFIAVNPEVTQRVLAERYGYTETWMSLIINSDAFQELLLKERDKLIDPQLKATVMDRFRALMTRSQDVLLEKLHTNPTPSLALGVMNSAARALGYGDSDRGKTVINGNVFVVEVPPVSRSSEEWAETRIIEGESRAVHSKAA